MNFAQLQFWIWLTLLVAGWLVARGLLARVRLWPSSGDRVALACVSLTLFWGAASTSFVIFAAEILINYAIAHRIARHRDKWSRVLLGVTIALNFIVLFYFKYIEFALRDLFGWPAADASALTRGLPVVGEFGIPPGISFYTFQMVGFLVDTWRSASRKPIALLDYVNFVSFFPQIVAGPIERRDDLLPQMQQFRWRPSWELVARGLPWLALGLAMKLVLANELEGLIDYDVTSSAWAVAASSTLFGLRIYFDFAGYSFVALGLGAMFGITLKRNFLSPYSARDIQEFWRRWHISLSGWFRDYLYVPLGGSRVKWVNANLFIVFLTSGLWHGAGVNFVLWGAFHGLWLIAHRYTPSRVRVPDTLARGVTFTGVMFSWLLFMESRGEVLRARIGALFTPSAWHPSLIGAAIPDLRSDQLVLAAVLVFATVLLLAEAPEHGDRNTAYRRLLRPMVAIILLIATVLLAAPHGEQFIYFAF